MDQSQVLRSAGTLPARGPRRLAWQGWVPYAAIAWSLAYAVLGVYWLASGGGLPYSFDAASNSLGPVIGRLGAGTAWAVVTLAGIPAAAVGVAMLRGLGGPAIRPVLIAGGGLISGVLLLLMTGLDLLILVGYIPYILRGLLAGDGVSQRYMEQATQAATLHQLLCLVGGFLWLGATVCYARLSAGACVYCGRGESAQPRQAEHEAAHWGRTAVYVSMVVPVFYAFTRLAWALGFPLGMTAEALHRGQESGLWIAGLFLAAFGLAGAALTLGLVQRWGERFPRWMIGLAGRRVPVALAVIPASLVSVLLVVGGIGIWSGLGRMVAAAAAGGAEGMEIAGEIIFQVGPTLLFPLWGAALAVAALGYYYRRRGPCDVCGRGALPTVTA